FCRASIRLWGVRPPGASRTRPCVASREPRQGRAPRGSDLARVPQPPTCIVRSGAPGPVVGDKRVGMAVAELVLGLEEGTLFGMLPVATCIQQFEPVGDRLAVGLFDGRKVRGRALALGVARHEGSPG